MTQPPQDPRQPNQSFGPSWPGQGGQPLPPGPFPPQPYQQTPYQPTPYPQTPYQQMPYPGTGPLGQQPLPTDDISRYAAPRPRGPILAAAAGVIVLVAVVVAGLFLQRPLVPAPASAPSAQQQSSLPGHPFQMPNNAAATGRWEILDREWSDAGVLVQVRVSCDTETCSYGFTSFPNNGSSSVDPEPSPRAPQLARGTLQSGQSASGYVFLPLPRGAATLILTTSAGRQVSALPITE